MLTCRKRYCYLRWLITSVLSRNEFRRPASSTTTRKTTTDDWLGLRPKSNAEVTSYEPSSHGSGGHNAARRHDFRRQSTQQRTSRSAGLLFSDDDEDDDNDEKKNKTTNRNVLDSLADATYRGTGVSAIPSPVTTTVNEDAAPVTDRTSWTAVSEPQTLSKRRETSPSIITVAKKPTAASGTQI